MTASKSNIQASIPLVTIGNFTNIKCLYPPLSHPTFDLINQKEVSIFMMNQKDGDVDDDEFA